MMRAPREREESEADYRLALQDARRIADLDLDALSAVELISAALDSKGGE